MWHNHGSVTSFAIFYWLEASHRSYLYSYKGVNIRRWGSLGDILESICHITCFSSVQSLSRVRLFAIPWTAARQASGPSPTPGSCSNSCPLNWWCYPTISSSVVPFSSYLQSFPASGSFPVGQLFASGGQSIHLFIYSFVEAFQLQHQSFQWIFRTDFISELQVLFHIYLHSHYLLW